MLVFYTAGYRFHFPTQRFIKTGSISLSSLPRQAMVFLNEKKQGTTPILLDQLFSGSYKIRLEKPGYIPWEKWVSVKETSTTVLENINLFLEENPLLLSPLSQKTLINPSGKNFILILEQAAWIELWQSSFDQIEKKLLLRLPQSRSENLSFKWSALGTYLLIEDNQNEKTHWTVIDLEKNIQQKIEINQMSPVSVMWDPDLDDTLYVQFPSGLYVFSLSQQTQEKLSDKTIMGIARGNDLLFVENSISQETLFVQKKGKNGLEEIVRSLPKGNYTFLKAPMFFALLQDEDQEKIYLFETSRPNEPLLLSTHAREAFWNPQNPFELLYVNEFEIHVYNLSTHTNELITRVSQPIDSIAWHPRANIIFYEENGKIVALDRYQQIQSATIPMVEMENIQEFWLSVDGKKLYFIGSENRQASVFERRLQK